MSVSWIFGPWSDYKNPPKRSIIQGYISVRNDELSLNSVD